MHRRLDAIGATGDDAAGIAAAFTNQVEIGKTSAETAGLPQDLKGRRGLALKAHDDSGLKSFYLAAELLQAFPDGSRDLWGQQIPQGRGQQPQGITGLQPFSVGSRRAIKSAIPQ